MLDYAVAGVGSARGIVVSTDAESIESRSAIVSALICGVKGSGGILEQVSDRREAGTHRKRSRFTHGSSGSQRRIAGCVQLVEKAVPVVLDVLTRLLRLAGGGIGYLLAGKGVFTLELTGLTRGFAGIGLTAAGKSVSKVVGRLVILLVQLRRRVIGIVLRALVEEVIVELSEVLVDVAYALIDAILARLFVGSRLSCTTIASAS